MMWRLSNLSQYKRRNPNWPMLFTKLYQSAVHWAENVYVKARWSRIILNYVFYLFMIVQRSFDTVRLSAWSSSVLRKMKFKDILLCQNYLCARYGCLALALLNCVRREENQGMLWWFLLTRSSPCSASYGSCNSSSTPSPCWPSFTGST